MSPISSDNPVVAAIIRGTAPQPARLAAARGLLPLPQSDLLEVLVALHSMNDPEIAEAATATLQEQEKEDLLTAATAEDTSTAVLTYLATSDSVGREIHEATILNALTPDDAIAKLASLSADSAILETIAVNQQRLIRSPQIIEAVLQNPARSPEAERKVKETRKEFFEKERGARQIADELRARGNSAAAEFFETADPAGGAGDMSLEDAWLIAQHIEVSDDDIDDAWLPAERYHELVPENYEEQAAAVNRILESEILEHGEVSVERVALIRRIMFMSVRDRVKLAIKGDREARSILVRDSNRIVSSTVIKNPRITEQEIEGVSAMRSVTSEVLRLISLNRAWARSYPIIHNLARNPRTPIPTVIGILPRIRGKDLQHLSQNRNVSDAVRKQAMRLAQVRSGN